MLNLQLRGGDVFNAANVVNFESLWVFVSTPSSSALTVRNVDTVAQVILFNSNGGSILIEDSDLSAGQIRVDPRVSVTIDAGSIVGLVHSLVPFPLDTPVADDTKSISIVNHGQILGDVRLYIGDDLLNSRLGTVGGNVYGYAGNDTIMTGAGDDWLDGGAGADILSAGAGNDELFGGSSSDQLDGGAGADAMDGGAGNDLFIVDNAGDVAIEAAGGGTDAVYSSVSYVLNDGSEVEYLSTLDWNGTASLNFTGNAIANWLIGNAGANILDGKAAADILQGRQGNDIYIVDHAGDVVYENAGEGADSIYTSASFALNDTLEVENLSTLDWNSTAALALTGNNLANYIIGNAGANVLRGNGGADIIEGKAGDDTIVGGAGADALFGGLGNDTYIVEDALDALVEAVGQGIDAAYTSVSFTLAEASEVENLSTLDWGSTAALNLTGNSLVNYIIGNAGANVIDGKGGADILVGKGGDDIYIVDNSAEIVYENAGEGADSIYTSASFVLNDALEVENVSTLDWNATTAIHLTGNSLANYMIGNAGANAIDGRGGNDILQGRGGADTFGFTTALGSGNVDPILDFATGSDKFQLDDAVFTGLALGALGANAFVIGAAAAMPTTASSTTARPARCSSTPTATAPARPSSSRRSRARPRSSPATSR